MHLHHLVLVLSCAHPIFRHVIIIHRVFLLFLLLNFIYFFTLYILFKHFFDPTKFPKLNLAHSLVYIGMRSSSVNLLQNVLSLLVSSYFDQVVQTTAWSHEIRGRC